MSDENTPTGADETFESQLDVIRIRLQSFEGPLDLLLHLIKKNKVNVYDIPIALITEQYLDYLDLMQELNLDVASEFLVMAATLIHIKSRMLLPRPESAAGDPIDDEDPRDALVRRLLEHQRFKAAAELLHERETLRSAQWTRPDARVEAIAGDDTSPSSKSTCSALLAAFRRVLERARERPPMPLPPEADLDRDAHRAAARAALGDRRAAASRSCSTMPAARAQLIVTFLAMLEMIRLKLVRVFQRASSAPIRVYKRARPKDAPHPIHDPEDEYKAHHRAAAQVEPPTDEGTTE